MAGPVAGYGDSRTDGRAEDEMTAPSAAGRRSAAARLAGISLLAAGVAFALYVAGGLLTPNYTFRLFRRVVLDDLLLQFSQAFIALGLVAIQVYLAVWVYRKGSLWASPPPIGPRRRMI